jgi:UDP-sugar transporter A1/2/3
MTSKAALALDKNALFYMFLLALQFGMQPTLTRKFTPGGICRSTVILMQELLKFILASTMLTLSGSKKSALSGGYLMSFRSVDFSRFDI